MCTPAAKVGEKRKIKERDEFEQYVKRSTDEHLSALLEIMEMQKEHPDHANRCWSGSHHNVPFLDVVYILEEERKRRRLNAQPADGGKPAQQVAGTRRTKGRKKV